MWHADHEDLERFLDGRSVPCSPLRSRRTCWRAGSAARSSTPWRSSRRSRGAGWTCEPRIENPRPGAVRAFLRRLGSVRGDHQPADRGTLAARRLAARRVLRGLLRRRGLAPLGRPRPHSLPARGPAGTGRWCGGGVRGRRRSVARDRDDDAVLARAPSRLPHARGAGDERSLCCGHRAPAAHARLGRGGVARSRARRRRGDARAGARHGAHRLVGGRRRGLVAQRPLPPDGPRTRWCSVGGAAQTACALLVLVGGVALLRRRSYDPLGRLS